MEIQKNRRQILTAVFFYFKIYKRKITDNYILLDEVQFLEEFEEVLNSLLHIKNLDIYVTGSNSKFLSSDVITEFRGRGDEIHVYPLSFREFTSAYDGNVDEAWDEYYNYGGMPLILYQKIVSTLLNNFGVVSSEYGVIKVYDLKIKFNLENYVVEE